MEGAYDEYTRGVERKPFFSHCLYLYDDIGRDFFGFEKGGGLDDVSNCTASGPIFIVLEFYLLLEDGASHGGKGGGMLRGKWSDLDWELSSFLFFGIRGNIHTKAFLLSFLGGDKGGGEKLGWGVQHLQQYGCLLLCA